MKKKLNLSLLSLFICVFIFSGFSDVSKDNGAYESITKLNELGILEGVDSDKFGIGRPITEGEFFKWISRVPYLDNSQIDDSIIDTAPLTKEKAVIMLVKALSYKQLAAQLSYFDSHFPDVTENKEYINIAKDFGIISDENSMFNPNSFVKREDAAIMLMNVYEKLNSKIEFLNGFYAINSYPQLEFAKKLDAISFGWSRFEFNNNILELNMTSKRNNEYSIPKDSDKVINFVKTKNNECLLMISVKDMYIDQDTSLTSYIVTSDELTDEAIDLILNSFRSENWCDGIVIDFEGLKGKDNKEGFNSFLSKLKSNLKDNEKLYVAVHPQTDVEFFDAYDYRTIGNLSDKVILMAHDYNAKSLTDEEMRNGITTTPLAPMDNVYYALKMITSGENSIEDKSKILLQISFGAAQWKLEDDKVLNRRPYLPSYNLLYDRIEKGVNLKYSTKYESPYMTFFDEDDSTDNIIWYENNQSVKAKIKLAKMFGINGFSIWRLGSIPPYSETDNPWER